MMLKFKAMANIIMSPKSLERPRLARDQGSARGCPVSRFSMFCLRGSLDATASGKSLRTALDTHTR